MEVTRVRFEAFKSLYDVTCDLDHFTVITGSNGAGKSNFVDALNFLGEVYRDGIEFAVGRAGGYDNVAHRRTRRAKRNVGFTIEGVVDSDELEEMVRMYNIPESAPGPIEKVRRLHYKHSFALGTASRSLLSDFVVTLDELWISDEDHRPLLNLRRSPRGTIDIHVERRASAPWMKDLLEPFTDKRFVTFLEERPLTPTTLVTDQMFYGPIFQIVRRALSRTRIFQLSAHQCRASGVPTPNALLERHGQNMPGAADHLRRNDVEAWGRVQDAMRSILPGLASIDIAYTEDRRLALQFRERGVGRPWNTGEVSDGTIQSLALFIALYDSRAPLMIIEEPENSIHPWILRQFLDLCRDAKAKQIVVTSHSPVLLNYVPQESVRVMSIANGRSRIIRLLDAAPQIRELVMNGGLSVFEAYDSGLIREAVPGGLHSGELDEDDYEAEDDL
jgi:predicted ATPase